MKRFFRDRSRDCTCPPEFPVCRCGGRRELAPRHAEGRASRATRRSDPQSRLAQRAPPRRREGSGMRKLARLARRARGARPARAQRVAGLALPPARRGGLRARGASSGACSRPTATRSPPSRPSARRPASRSAPGPWAWCRSTRRGSPAVPPRKRGVAVTAAPAALFTMQDIADAAGGPPRGRPADGAVASVSHRFPHASGRDALFVALRGEHTDGHRFLGGGGRGRRPGAARERGRGRTRAAPSSRTSPPGASTVDRGPRHARRAPAPRPRPPRRGSASRRGSA